MAIIRKESKKIKDITGFNVNLSCVVDSGNRRMACEKCEKFFSCKDENKWEVYKAGRLGLARQRMAQIKYKIAIVGGKGGVGKTMLAVNLAAGLAMRGFKVAILDSDYDGSSVPRMLGLVGKQLSVGERGIEPLMGACGIKVISMSNIVEGKMVTLYTDTRRGVTEEFITHVNYGECDFLIVDLPPGTSADTVNSMLFIPDMTGTIFITVPSEVSQGIAFRAVNICKTAQVPSLGIVENMSGHMCSFCNHISNIFATGGGEKLSSDTSIPLIGKIPIDGYVAKACDEGTPFVQAYVDCPATKAMEEITDKVLKDVETVSRDLSYLDRGSKSKGWWDIGVAKRPG